MDSFENLESVRKELEELEKQVAGLEQAKINAATGGTDAWIPPA